MVIEIGNALLGINATASGLDVLMLHMNARDWRGTEAPHFRPRQVSALAGTKQRNRLAQTRVPGVARLQYASLHRER